MNRKSLIEINTEFYKAPVLCVLALIVVHVLPKDGMSMLYRFILMMVFFCSILLFLWQFTQPLKVYLRNYYSLVYEDCGPVLEQLWQSSIHSLTKLITAFMYVLIAFFLFTALKTFQHWPLISAVDIFEPFYRFGWWISIAAVVFFPFWANSMISEALQRYRILREQVTTSGFTPKNSKDFKIVEMQNVRPPVESIRDYAFNAGGYEWSWDDFYKNCIIFGQSGTGKTVCVLNALIDGLMASTYYVSEIPSGLMLDPKGDYHSKIKLLCANHNREKDLLIVDPFDINNSIRWNPFDSEDDELELASRFAAVLASLGMKADNDSFWIDSSKKFIRHAIALIRLTNEEGMPPSFAEIGELASSHKRISERADKIAIDDPRGDQCLSYFCDEWMDLATETRSSVQAQITNMIDPFLMEPYATIFSGKSTFRISDMLETGKILYVYMPIADKEAMSKVICTFIKLEYYREVLKRPDKTRRSFFICDEFQSFFTTGEGKGDADFFERSRQSNHANIIASQNLQAFFKQSKEKAHVENMLGNCAVKIFLRNTDIETNEYASKLFGEHLVGMLTSTNSGGGGFAGMRGSSTSQGQNFQYDAKVRKEAFTELSIPSRNDGIDYCEAIVHLASRGQVKREKLKWKVYPLKG